MRVLVTGGAGFIGSHLTECLLADGEQVRVLDNLSTGKRANLAAHSALEFIQGDIRDPDDVQAAATGCDAIVHLAAVASVQASIDDPVGTHGSNFVGTLNLLEAARAQGIRRFIYASSAAVYGDTVDLPVREEAIPKPQSPYAADKLAGEQYLLFYANKHGLATTAFRFFNIYGPRQDPSSPYSGAISIFVSRAQRGESVVIFGDGMQTRDFVYVSDLADILALSLRSTETAGQVINVGRGIESSLLDILSEIEQLVGRPIERRHEVQRVGDIRRSCARVERLQKLLQRIPETPLRTGLRLLLEHSSLV